MYVHSFPVFLLIQVLNTALADSSALWTALLYEAPRSFKLTIVQAFFRFVTVSTGSYGQRGASISLRVFQGHPNVQLGLCTQLTPLASITTICKPHCGRRCWHQNLLSAAHLPQARASHILSAAPPRRARASHLMISSASTASNILFTGTSDTDACILLMALLRFWYRRMHYGQIQQRGRVGRRRHPNPNKYQRQHWRRCKHPMWLLSSGLDAKFAEPISL